MAAIQVVRSEWTKIRSVASTVWTLSLAVVVTIALGMLISALSRHEFDKMSRQDRLTRADRTAHRPEDGWAGHRKVD